MNKCSSSTSTCACASTQIKENRSSREIIFGWDRFSTIASLILIVAFITWSVIFFLSIDNHSGHSADGGHGDHGDHGDHGSDGDHGDHGNHGNDGDHGDHVDHGSHAGHEDSKDHSNLHFIPLMSKFHLAADQEKMNFGQ
ncbi:nacrein-like protein P1 [Leptopilina heterotoma]|uniref:nacrein-like protein P1 n=1 Tax=Leptopilina heterotoma TaxID=63436 RepID=UPI001CA92F84|nr:nacrein-like protein P1 [Leptopilina heterotoma]